MAISIIWNSDGMSVGGETRPVKDLLKAHGLRWSRTQQLWYLPSSRDRRPEQHRVDDLAETLRGAGHDVEIEVDDVRRSTAEIEADRAERAAVRAERLAGKADRLAGKAEAHFEQVDRIGALIPLGQPILVGHHSERRHRRDLERIDQGMRRGMEAVRERDETGRRAWAAEANQARRMSGPVTIRRIEELEAEQRRMERAGRDYVVADLGEQIEYWRAHLAGLVESGVYRLWGPADFVAGDRVNESATVVRVNCKSLTVRYDVFAHTSTLRYDKVRSVERAGGPTDAG